MCQNLQLSNCDVVVVQLFALIGQLLADGWDAELLLDLQGRNEP